MKVKADIPYEDCGAENLYAFYRNSVCCLCSGTATSRMLQSKLTVASEYQIFSSVTLMQAKYSTASDLGVVDGIFPLNHLLSDCIDPKYASPEEIKARRRMEFEALSNGQSNFIVQIKIVENFVSFLTSGKIDFYEVQFSLLDFHAE